MPKTLCNSTSNLVDFGPCVLCPKAPINIHIFFQKNLYELTRLPEVVLCVDALEQGTAVGDVLTDNGCHIQ